MANQTGGKGRSPGKARSTSTTRKPFSDRPVRKNDAADDKKPVHRKAWVTRPPKGQYVPDPKDANTVNALRAKLMELREYKRILAADGLRPDEDDKQLESELIVQLIRIEKGLPPKKAPKKKAKKIKEKESKGKSKFAKTDAEPVKKARRGGGRNA